MSKALLLVDIQNDYFPGGKMELVDAQRMAANAGQLLALCRQKGIPIIHIQHVSVRPGTLVFHYGTEGIHIHASVAPLPGETVIQKNYANSFRATSLHEQLQSLGVRELVICGAMSHMCIDTTVRAAFDLGYHCTVVEDACATRNLEFNGVAVEAAKVHAAFMAALAYGFAKVTALKNLEL
ncbi:MAG: cysteine hydrolase [Sedimentisphaerales bacterium]|nr:cysteine hydrolase [Sedimentisphaerales bacterium]